MKFIWIEILKFFKNNIIKIIIGTVLIAGIYLWRTSQQTNVELESLDEGDNGEKLVLDSGPAHFRFYIEYSDSNTFTNNLLIEQYITRPNVLREAARETDTKLDKIVEETENIALVDYSETGESKVIGVNRDGTTNLHEFYVNSGNEQDNLEIANFYYDYIIDGNIPFFEDKKLYFIHSPKIKEYDDSITFNSSAPTNQRSLLRNGILGVVLGGLLTTGVLTSLTFISRKLKYSFSYSLREDDYFFLVDDRVDYQEKLNQILLTPRNNDHIVIHEGNDKDIINYLSKVLGTKEKDNAIKIVSSFLEIESLEDIDRLIYIVSEDVTTRSWYNNQRNLDRMYDVPTVIIQVNK